MQRSIPTAQENCSYYGKENKMSKNKNSGDIYQIIRNVSKKYKPSNKGSFFDQLMSYSDDLFMIGPSMLETCADEYFDGFAGYFVDENHIYAPSVLPEFEHEIAHFIEMRNYRVVMNDFGFPGLNTLAKELNVFKTFLKHTSFEGRARAVQSIISEKNHSETLANRIIGHSTYGTRKGNHFLEGFTNFNTEKQYHDWLTTLFYSTIKNWSKEKIIEEMKSKVKFVRSWQQNQIKLAA